MHNAPSVSYPVGRSRLAGIWLTAGWAAGTLAVAGWAWQVQPRLLQVAFACTVVVAAGACAWICWRCVPDGMLAWDEQLGSWSVGERRVEAHPEVVLDFQRTLLLRLGQGRGAPWLWLEKASLPGRWDDLRRAVYSRARTEGSPGARPPREPGPDER